MPNIQWIKILKLRLDYKKYINIIEDGSTLISIYTNY